MSGVAAFPGRAADLFCTTGEDGTLRVWNARHRNAHMLANGQRAVRAMGMPGCCCAVSPDARAIAVGHQGGQFTVWDAESLLCGVENALRKRAVSALAFSPDGALLAVATRAGSVDLYSTRERYRRLGGSTEIHSTAVTAMDFAADGALLRSCDGAGRIAYWELPALRPFRGHESGLRDVEWHTENGIFRLRAPRPGTRPLRVT